jgi:hypothetical protein
MTTTPDPVQGPFDMDAFNEVAWASVEWEGVHPPRHAWTGWRQRALAAYTSRQAEEDAADIAAAEAALAEYHEKGGISLEQVKAELGMASRPETDAAGLSPSDPAAILAGIRQFGLASDGADLRDLDAALTALQSALAARDARVAELERERDVIDRMKTNVRHWRNEVGRLNAILQSQPDWKARAERLQIDASKHAHDADTVRLERDTERAARDKAEADAREHLRLKNQLVLAAYPAMDAVDAIRAWCEAQPYENDLITVVQLRDMLPPARAEAKLARPESAPTAGEAKPVADWAREKATACAQWTDFATRVNAIARALTEVHEAATAAERERCTAVALGQRGPDTRPGGWILDDYDQGRNDAIDAVAAAIRKGAAPPSQSKGNRPA